MKKNRGFSFVLIVVALQFGHISWSDDNMPSNSAKVTHKIKSNKVCETVDGKLNCTPKKFKQRARVQGPATEERKDLRESVVESQQ